MKAYAPDDSGRIPPVFAIGQRVRVRSGRTHLNLWIGYVRDIGWHDVQQCWHYYLRTDAKKINTRYVEEDLEPLS